MIPTSTIDRIRVKYSGLQAILDERARRYWAATEARALGHGGVQALARITGLAPDTIKKGLEELVSPEEARTQPERIRRPGGGRKPITEEHPEIIDELENLLEPNTRGDPMNPLRWTSRSVRKIADELKEKGFRVSHQKVAELLHEMGYSLQANKKIIEGSNHPDRDEQFSFINQRTKEFQSAGQPVVSVDTKKKELIGNFKNGGQEWRKLGQPRPVRDHDFEDKDLGKAIPFGVYDVTGNQGMVSVGVDHDTAEFAVNSIRTWWLRMGKAAYPDALELLITADCGGSNGYRTRLWKTELQKLANETGLAIQVCHFPPGTSKWNTIEHSMFSQISMNWRGQPLETLETVVSLIGKTTTKRGLRIEAVLDQGKYEKGRKVPKTEIDAIEMARDPFHGEWNYRIVPKEENAVPGDP